MTFYEAAVEVLREAGRPLHFKKITEISIRRDLLSHVGKTPEITMGARLEIEAAKPANETLLVRVRPGVYSLREGADVADAAQTIRPRGYVEVPEEETEETDDVVATEDAAEAETPATPNGEAKPAAEADANGAASESNASRRRRRRGRRGGRGRARDGEAGEGDETDSAADDAGDDVEDDVAAEAALGTDAPATDDNGTVGSWDPVELDDETPAAPAPRPAAVKPAPKPAPAPAQARKPQPAPPARPERAPRPVAAADPLALGEAGDVARAIVAILQASSEPAVHARAIAGELAAKRVAGLGKVGPAVLREHIEFANLRRTRLGRPPLFEEVRPNQWAVATASGSALAASYAALDQWQDTHRDALRRTLLERLRALGGEALCSVVGLTLDRLGYRDIRTHDPIGDELMTLSATTPRALTGTRIAVRIARPGTAISRERIAALRGALHSYDSTEGAYIAIGGFEDAAHVESKVANLAPIALIDAEKLADHMLMASVGVTTFHVDVRCIDESLFRDLPNGP